MFRTIGGGVGVDGRRSSAIGRRGIVLAIVLLGLTWQVAAGQTEPAGVLTVTPLSGLDSKGIGVVSPTSQTYTLTNTGTAALNWKVTFHHSSYYWELAGPDGPITPGQGGALEPGTSTTVTVRLYRYPPSGDNPAGNTLIFTNLTNGAGTTSRDLDVWVQRPAEMPIKPEASTKVSAVWIKGDTISKLYVREYQWDNYGDFPLRWDEYSLQSWLTTDSRVFHPGPGCGAMTVYINPEANYLAVGTHTGTIYFTGSGTGLIPEQQNQTRTIELKVVWPGDIDADFAVGETDLLLMAASWDRVWGQAGYSGRCDINRDKVVDVLDLMALVADFGKAL